MLREFQVIAHQVHQPGLSHTQHLQTAATGTKDAQQAFNTSQDLAQIIHTGTLQKLPRKFEVVIWDGLNLISPSSSF